MAYPQVAATSSVGDLSSSTPEALTLPAGVSNGDRLLAFVAFDADSDPMVIVGTGTGWTKRIQQDGQQTAGVQSAIFEKLEADGNDSLTISTTGNVGTAELGVYIVRRYTGHDPAVEAAIAASHGSSANPDAPSLSPSWGAADTLWEWVAAWDNGTRTITAYPADYTANQATNLGGATSAGCGIAAATRQLNASSTDPGLATISLADNWNAYTIAIKPAGGSDTTAPVLSSPVGTATGATTATVGATTDEANGTLYVFVSTSATPPSAATLKAGTGAAFASSQAVTSSGAKTFGATGLTASTGYYAHLIHTDAAGNDSNIVSSAQFTTSTPDTTAPTLSSPTGAGGALVCSGTVTTNEAGGTLYAVVTDSATPPSVSQVKAGQDHTGTAALRAVSQAVSASGVQTVGSGAVTSGTRYFYYVHTDASSNDSTVAASPSFEVTAAATNDIRLQPGIRLERGGEAASRTVARWWVFSADLLTIVHTGTSVSTNSAGQLTIDINDSPAYVVGDLVPMLVGEWDAVPPLDRTVRSGLMWVQAIAQA